LVLEIKIEAFYNFLYDVNIEVSHHPETIQLLSLISDHSGQGLIWNKDPSVPLFLQVVILDVSPDEPDNLAS
jgi:hypothetical protein